MGFNLRNGGISVLYDAVPLSGRIVLLGLDQDKPAVIGYGGNGRKPSFDASMVRDGNGGESSWVEIGSAWREDDHVAIQLEVVPTGGKVVLTQPKERE